MSRTGLLKSPGGRWAVILASLWLACWVLLMGVWPKAQWAGVPMLTWSMIALGVLAVLISVWMIFRMEAHERR